MMKKLIYLMLFFVGITLNSTAQEINWITIEEAVALQKKTPKKIIMDVYTTWCGPCKQLDKLTFHNKNVVNYINQNYYAVKFNGEGNKEINYMGKVFKNPYYKPEDAFRRNTAHEFARYLQISAYPTIVFFDEYSNVITPLKGYQNPSQLELYLKMFKNNDHKKITSQEEFNTYFENFKSVF